MVNPLGDCSARVRIEVMTTHRGLESATNTVAQGWKGPEPRNLAMRDCGLCNRECVCIVGEGGL